MNTLQIMFVNMEFLIIGLFFGMYLGVNSKKIKKKYKIIKRQINHFIVLVFTKYVSFLIPIKRNFVLFESYLGKAYGGNPKYIYLEMLNTHSDYTFIWSFSDPIRIIEGNPIIVKRLSMKYLYYLLRSKILITDSRLPNYIYPNKKTKFVQTWHGTPLKRLALDMENVTLPNTDEITYKKNFTNSTKQWDYLISQNSYSSNIFQRAFAYEHKPILEIGYPRNDILFTHNNLVQINKLKNN